jgi:hypothetical protein
MDSTNELGPSLDDLKYMLQYIRIYPIDELIDASNKSILSDQILNLPDNNYDSEIDFFIPPKISTTKKSNYSADECSKPKTKKLSPPNTPPTKLPTV